MTSQDRPTEPGATRPQPPGAPAVEAPWPMLGGLPLHPRLEAVLRRLRAAERAAVGQERRPAFKLTREFLGASVRLGVPTPLLAACMGTSRASLRNRASRADGVIAAELVRQLTDLTPRQLDSLSRGELTRGRNPADRPEYRTIDVVRALLSTPRPVKSANEDETAISQTPAGRVNPSSFAARPATTDLHEAESFSEFMLPGCVAGPSLPAGYDSGMPTHDRHGDR